MKTLKPITPSRWCYLSLCSFLQNAADQMTPSVRKGYLRAFRKLEQLAIKSRTSLKKYLADLTDKQLGIALWVLGRVGLRTDVPDILQVRRSRPNEAVVALEALANLGGEQARRKIVRSLKDMTERIKVRIEVCHTLGHRWRGIVQSPTFFPIASDVFEDASLRGYVLEGIGLRARSGGEVLRKARNVVIACLDDPVASVRFWAVFAVAQLEAQAALSKIRCLLAATKL